MSVLLGYLAVIAIWSTTPLAIKWSGQGSGIFFGVTSRMLIGLLLCVILMMLLRRRLPMDRASRSTYVAGSLAVFASMLSVYWGSQFISSGLISVVFGLTPIMTGVFASLWLQERGISPLKLFGLLLSLSGLVVIFDVNLNMSTDAGYGVAGVFLGVLFHSLSTVWIKRIGSDIPVLALTTGCLLLSVPLFILCWWLFDSSLPAHIPERTAGAILYLGVVGSVIGYLMFFYVLKHSSATQAGLITLITPVMALLLGNMLNDEVLTLNVWVGTLLVLLGLSIFQWAGLLWRRYRSARVLP